QLWDEPFVAAPEETGLWRDYHLATAERQGHPVRIRAVTDQPDAYLTAIANGDGIALVPESASRYYARPGITYRPVTGVSPSQVGVAWAPPTTATASSRTSSAAAWTTSRQPDPGATALPSAGADVLRADPCGQPDPDGRGPVRRAGHRGRYHRGRHRAGRGGARAVGGAGREERLRRRDLGAVIAAGARRPALPGARGVRPGAGVAAGAGHPVPAGAAPGAPGSHVHAGRRPAPPGHLPGRADRVRGAGGGPEHRLPHVGERRAGGAGHTRAGRTVARIPV